MLTKSINFTFSIIPISLIFGNFAINLNIFIIDAFFIFFILIKHKQFDWIKSNLSKQLFLLYLFLILNSIFNYFLYPSYGLDGLYRSIGFIKFIFLIFSFQYLINKKEQLDKILRNWMIIITIVIFDVFLKEFFGHNLLGFESKDITRIISFFL